MLSPLTGQTARDPLPAHMPAIDPCAEIYPDACRAMWIAVMGEAWRQAFHPNALEGPNHTAAARRWFGSRDFRIICGLIDLDPDDVMAAFRRALITGAPRQPIRWCA